MSGGVHLGDACRISRGPLQHGSLGVGWAVHGARHGEAPGAPRRVSMGHLSCIDCGQLCILLVGSLHVLCSGTERRRVNTQSSLSPLGGLRPRAGSFEVVGMGGQQDPLGVS